MTEIEVAEQVRSFETLRPKYSAFVESLKGLILKLLDANNLIISNIEARTKTIDSFKGKIEREDKNYSDPINQITDLAGIRIIAYQLNDIDLIDEIIKNNFDLDEENSIDKRKVIDADRFGYLSVHYVIKLNQARIQLQEYSSFSDLRCEIQVRTVLQHAWAAIDHKLRYKSKDEIPQKLRRQLYRISALLETADEQFESLAERISQLQNQYIESVSKGAFDIPLDIESLNAYMDNSAHINTIIELANKTGIIIAPHSSNCKLPEYSHLLPALQLAEIQTISNLDQISESISPKIEEVLDKINNAWKANVNEPNLRLVVTKDSLVKIVILFGIQTTKAKKMLEKLKFGEKLKIAIQTTYKEMNNKTI